MAFWDNGFPAELSSCVSVDMLDFPSQYIIKLSRDHPIEYIARGENVLTLSPGGGYTSMTGTSFTTPTVTGLCAFLVGAFLEIKTLLKAFTVENL